MSCSHKVEFTQFRLWLNPEPTLNLKVGNYEPLIEYIVVERDIQLHTQRPRLDIQFFELPPPLLNITQGENTKSCIFACKFFSLLNTMRRESNLKDPQ